ncbi:MAG: potassium-transporting ATPase subunit KdpC [candidate division Zixibacteria bacterium]|nr:potassium-transporting ATPase subunit KdpC [candidate division Zixibacteria bacterium]
MKTVWISIRVFAVLSILTGLIYPLMMTGVAQVLFPHQAKGSLIIEHGLTSGSALIGQAFTSNKYFWPRPSAVAYNPLPSGGTNLGPTAVSLRDSVVARAARFGAPIIAVPSDLLEASGSGLDPHISPEAALFQIDRILDARGRTLAGHSDLANLVVSHTEPPQFGLLGEPRVNVLELNLALDSLMH